MPFTRRTGAPSLVYARPRLLITSPQRCTGSQLAVSVRKCALASCSGSTTRLQRHAAMQRWLLASTAALAAAAAPRRVAVTGAGGQTGQLAFRRMLARRDEFEPVWKSKFYGVFVLNHRVVIHAIDATPARWRGNAGSSPLDGAGTATSSPRNDLVKNCRVHPTHWLISTQRRT